MIKTRGLRKSFGIRRGREKIEVEAVCGVDLSVSEGEIFGFLGPNGAGKTTTVRILATLLRPDSGTATVAGRDLAGDPREIRRRIGYVSQAGGVDDGVTVYENVLLQGRLCRLGAQAAGDRASELLGTFELAALADQPARSLSGGQKRRLALALGLVHSPVLLFLDEPTLGLDPQGRARLWAEVRRLRAAGTTVFLTTHYLEEADALCDNLAIIDHGRIVARGTPGGLKSEVAGDSITFTLVGRETARAHAVLRPLVRDIRPDGQTLRVYVKSAEDALPRLIRALADEGLDIEGIAMARPSLDDVFLQQTGRSLREELS